MKNKIALVDSKVDLKEMQSIINNINSDYTQKNFELRQDLFKKITEIQSKIGEVIKFYRFSTIKYWKENWNRRV